MNAVWRSEAGKESRLLMRTQRECGIALQSPVGVEIVDGKLEVERPLRSVALTGVGHKSQCRRGCASLGYAAYIAALGVPSSW